MSHFASSVTSVSNTVESKNYEIIMSSYRFVLIILANQWAVSGGNIFSGFTDAILEKIPPPSAEDKEILGESEMSVAEICQKYEYVCETYTVNTNDGFILDLNHLVRAQNDVNISKPVLLMHGLMGSSRYWFDTDKNSLAFYLFDNGYDVWLGNFRGNYYTKHIKYSRDQKQFWDHCLDDLATKDVPAIIDAILEKSGAERVVYIGYSMGTSVGFAFFSSMKDYFPKIAGFIALSPVANLRYVTSFAKPLVSLGKLLSVIYKIAGIHEIGAVDPKARKVLQYVCPARNTAICEFAAIWPSGFDPYLKNQTKRFITATHSLNGVSTKLMTQYSQIYNKNKFCKYDYGRVKNLEVYRSETAPAYNLTEITIPVALVYGPNDALSDSIDNCLLIRKLPNLVGVKLIDFGMFNHDDTMFAVNNNELYYEDVNIFLRKMFF